MYADLGLLGNDFPKEIATKQNLRGGYEGFPEIYHYASFTNVKKKICIICNIQKRMRALTFLCIANDFKYLNLYIKL